MGTACLVCPQFVQELVGLVHCGMVRQVKGDGSEDVPRAAVLDAGADSCTRDSGFAVFAWLLAEENGSPPPVTAGFSGYQLPAPGAFESRPFGHGHLLQEPYDDGSKERVTPKCREDLVVSVLDGESPPTFQVSPCEFSGPGHGVVPAFLALSETSRRGIVNVAPRQVVPSSILRSSAILGR